MRKMIARLLKNQSGQGALIAVLLLLVLGAVLITPLLGLMTASLKAGQMHESRLGELYAADAGVEDALWYLQNDTRLQSLPGSSGSWSYSLPEDINHRAVNIAIDRVWLLNGTAMQGLGLPATEPGKTDTCYGNDHWFIIGAVNFQNDKNYVVDITTNDTAGGSALVAHIGVWLPAGYTYNASSTTINGNASAIGDPQKIPYRGGTALIWSWSSKTFDQLSKIPAPSSGGGMTPGDKYPPSVRLSFNFTLSTGVTEAKGFFPWIKLADGRLAWDPQAGIYRIQSTGITSETGAQTVLTTYSPRTVARKTSGTGGTATSIHGDYIAIGNTLMTSCWKPRSGSQCGVSGSLISGPNCTCNCSYECRSYKVSESSAKINSDAVPSDAQLVRAWLYWSAWRQSSNQPDIEVILKVNGVPVEGEGQGTPPAGRVEADRSYTLKNTYGYSYSCFADVTKQVTDELGKQYAGAAPVNGVNYTVGNVDADNATGCSTGQNEWCYAGWSMILVYSSAEVESHELYLYDQFLYADNNSNHTLTFCGFEAPHASSEIDGRLTVFAGEGDSYYTGDSLQFKGEGYPSFVSLGDSVNPANNVWNSKSNVVGFSASSVAGQQQGQISGVDIDTYNVSAYISPGDKSAQIKAQTRSDSWNWVYTIVSLRSVKSAGEGFQVGTMSYEYSIG